MEQDLLSGVTEIIDTFTRENQGSIKETDLKSVVYGVN
jgi:hypothetical protein